MLNANEQNCLKKGDPKKGSSMSCLSFTLTALVLASLVGGSGSGSGMRCQLLLTIESIGGSWIWAESCCELTIFCHSLLTLRLTTVQVI